MPHSYQSPYPRTTLHNQITTMGSNLSRVWSSDSTATLTAKPLPPQSRRRRFQSSGRGGAGNIHKSPPDLGESTCISESSDDTTVTQEPRLRPPQVVSTGRGGRGNMRLRRIEDTHARSQPQAEADVAEYERLIREVTRESRQVSSGRGGAGNVTSPVVYPYPTASATVMVSVSVVTL